VKVIVKTVHSEKINDDNAHEYLKNASGILVAPGFGDRGIQGKIDAVKYARENKVPFLGICLGMQCAVIEFGRNVLNYTGAHSTEFNSKTDYPVIDMMENQKKISGYGGTMRLGAYPCEIIEGSHASNTYDNKLVSERHRHRFEFNDKYIQKYEDAGMRATGINPKDNLVEIVEIEDHPWFMGVQFHPEYKSTVANPHPVFVNFVKAANAFSQK